MSVAILEKLSPRKIALPPPRKITPIKKLLKILKIIKTQLSTD